VRFKKSDKIHQKKTQQRSKMGQYPYCDLLPGGTLCARLPNVRSGSGRGDRSGLERRMGGGA